MYKTSKGIVKTEKKNNLATECHNEVINIVGYREGF